MFNRSTKKRFLKHVFPLLQDYGKIFILRLLAFRQALKLEAQKETVKDSFTDEVSACIAAIDKSCGIK